MSIAVALADKIDTLVGFWAIDEKPTGSKDPYALRRAALGVIRLILENGLRLKLVSDAFLLPFIFVHRDNARHTIRPTFESLANAQKLLNDDEVLFDAWEKYGSEMRSPISKEELLAKTSQLFDLLSFFIDRLKVYLRDRGARYDLIDAALGAIAAPSSDPLRRATFSHKWEKGIRWHRTISS